jgi:hypothetical protein
VIVPTIPSFLAADGPERQDAKSAVTKNKATSKTGSADLFVFAINTPLL